MNKDTKPFTMDKDVFETKCLPDLDWSSIRGQQQEYYGPTRTSYSVEIFGLMLAMQHRVFDFAWKYVLQDSNEEEASADSDDSLPDEEPTITVSNSPTAANKSKLVITQFALRKKWIFLL
ncbi:hypothetical protein RclHR1_11350001 [Rhizophagus clarus]|uniref:Uncharacterized protein n=1 Tax=Rhizophagus clarus TaxID=94130 RepID=A0A2Z6Q5I4_9GLOM|nr:hypothetical protein RclHR1_11350001 [Rhizophagus clarus]